MNLKEKPIIAITMGDPAGIGPELCLKAVAEASVLGECRPLIVGDAVQLEAATEISDAKMPAWQFQTSEPISRALIEANFDQFEGRAGIINLHALKVPLGWGKATDAGGAASYAYIEHAINGTLRGTFDAICTAPISKLALHLAGIDEPGHTEILAKRTATANYGMMLYSEKIAVSLVTIHQSLASVPASLSREEICRIARLGDATLRRLRGRAPRQAVLGLNPHAGEAGMFGDEEQRVIEPAVEQLKREGLDVEGPLPPDTAFTSRALERYDGHVVMYHDQGLIPFKMLAIDEGVNLTMGLPIVRTSPDHGTAYDIAGRNKADMRSMIEAIKLAARWAQHKAQTI